MIEDHICQILVDGVWMDYSRCTKVQAQGWCKQKPTTRRAKDWITGEVVIPSV